MSKSRYRPKDVLRIFRILRTFLVKPEDVDNKSSDYDNEDTDHNSQYGAAESTIFARLNCYSNAITNRHQTSFKANVFHVLVLNMTDMYHGLSI